MTGNHDMGLSLLLDSRSTGFPWKEEAFTMFTDHPSILWRKPNLGAHPDLPSQFHVSLGEGGLHFMDVYGLLEEDVDPLAGYLPDFAPVSPPLHCDEPLVHDNAFPPMIKFFPGSMLRICYASSHLGRGSLRTDASGSLGASKRRQPGAESWETPGQDPSGQNVSPSGYVEAGE